MATRHDAQRCSSPQKRKYRKTTALKTRYQPAVANLEAMPAEYKLVIAEGQQNTPAEMPGKQHPAPAMVKVLL